MRLSERLLAVSARPKILAGCLLALHGAMLAGFHSPLGRMLLTAHLGAFLLWQPVVPGTQRMGARQLAGLALALGVFHFLLSWVSLAVWAGLLASLVAAQAIPRGSLRDRLPELAAFGYLAAVIVGWLVPVGVPVEADTKRLLEVAVSWGGVAAILLPLVFCPERRTAPMSDLATALVVFLSLGGIVLTAIVFMFLSRADYATMLLRAVASVAIVLLLLGWLWNPRGGFSGVGLLLSRRALAGGMALDAWLSEVADDTRYAPSPQELVAAAATRMLDMPGVRGVRWEDAQDPALVGEVGTPARYTARFDHPGLTVTLESADPLDASTLWRWDLMVRILAEFTLARRQSQALTELSYLRAIHETGARLTHDVKNLLQSMETLSYAIEQGVERDPLAIRELVRRQLPALSQRLRLTLTKLRQPGELDETYEPLSVWWERVQIRFAAAGVVFERTGPLGPESVPCGVLEGFSENCIQNALEKRAQYPSLAIRVRLFPIVGRLAVEIEDDGPAIDAERAAALMHQPVASHSGLGVGLFQVAREAAEQGWHVGLAENRNGCVRFRLERV